MSDEETNVDRRPVAAWLKVVAIILVIMVVGPLLFAMFYSAIIGVGAQKALGDAVALTYPYVGYFILAMVLLMIVEFLWRQGRKQNPRLLIPNSFEAHQVLRTGMYN